MIFLRNGVSVVGWDLAAVKKANGLAGSNKSVDLMMDLIARYGHWAFVIYGLILWFAPGKNKGARRESCLMAFFSICLCSVISLIIGKIWKRKRPFAEDPAITNFTDHKANASFPSNHTMNGAAVAFQLLRDGMPGSKIMVVLAVVLAFSRLFAGIHYPTDLLGGISIAGAMHYVLNCPAVRAWAGMGAFISMVFEKALCLWWRER